MFNQSKNYVSESSVLNLSKNCLKIIIWCPLSSLLCQFPCATTWMRVSWKASDSSWDSSVSCPQPCGLTSKHYNSPLWARDDQLARDGHPWTHCSHWMQPDLKRLAYLPPKKRAGLSLWNLDKVTQDKGARELWILALHSYGDVGLGPLWAVLVHSSRRRPLSFFGMWSQKLLVREKRKDRRKGSNRDKHVSMVSKWSFHTFRVPG